MAREMQDLVAHNLTEVGVQVAAARRLVNRGQLAEAGWAGEQQLKAAAGTGGLTWGVILVGIGALWLANSYLDLEWFWDVMDTWGGPVAIILLGLILIIAHVMKRRRENEAHVGMPPRSY